MSRRLLVVALLTLVAITTGWLVTVFAQSAEYTYTFLTGREPGEVDRGHPLIHGLYGILPTADGHVGIIGVLLDQREAFFGAIGRPELAGDARFTGVYLPPDVRGELFDLLSDTFPGRTTAAWIERLREMGVTVIANIFGETQHEFETLAGRFDRTEGVSALELNVSCPNTDKGGIEFGVDPVAVSRLTAAIKKVTRLPVIVKLSMEGRSRTATTSVPPSRRSSMSRKNPVPYSARSDSSMRR